MKKNILALGLLFSAIIMTGAGCQQTENLPLYTGLNETAPNETNESAKSSSENIVNNEPVTEKTIPEKVEPKEQIGTAKAKFINKISGTPIPGHMIRCTGCTNGNVLESNLNGEITLKFDTNSSNPVYFSAHRVDWHNYNPVMNIKPGDNIIVKTDPQVVDQGMRIFFPKATYTKNSAGKMQLNLTYKDSSGLPKANSPINITGPIEGIGRKTAWGITNASGKATITLPINGAYRISIGKDFFQFETPTGYDVNLVIDYSKLNEAVSGTESLSKGFQERGMILVCVREKATDKPIFATVMVSTGELITRTVKYNEDICTEIPKSYDMVGVLPTDQYKGLQYASTSGVDNNGVLYLYVEHN